ADLVASELQAVRERRANCDRVRPIDVAPNHLLAIRDGDGRRGGLCRRTDRNDGYRERQDGHGEEERWLHGRDPTSRVRTLFEARKDPANDLSRSACSSR